MGQLVIKVLKTFCMDGPVAGHNHKHIVPSTGWTGKSILMRSESKLQFNSWYVFEHLQQHNT